MGYIVVKPDELYHARSHKYIRKEPNGKGGWRYYYNTGRPNKNASGNTYTKVSDGSKPWNYESSSNSNSPKVAEDMYNRAVRDRDLLLKAQNRGAVLSKEEKADLQYYNAIINGEGRNMAVAKQEADRHRKADLESKKLSNVVKSTVNSISTVVGSAYDKGKKWLSGIFSTKETLSTLDGNKIGERVVSGWTKKPSGAMEYHPPKRK